MDFLRSCYYSKMAIYRDRPDILVAGRWRFCPPGAKMLPFAHGFGSSVWLPDPEKRPPLPTAESGQGAYYNGRASPSWTGQHFCGNADVWLNGGLYADRGNLPVDAQGIPLCCAAPAAELGGGVGNGSAFVWSNV